MRLRKPATMPHVILLSLLCLDAIEQTDLLEYLSRLDVDRVLCRHDAAIIWNLSVVSLCSIPRQYRRSDIRSRTHESLFLRGSLFLSLLRPFTRSPCAGSPRCTRTHRSAYSIECTISFFTKRKRATCIDRIDLLLFFFFFLLLLLGDDHILTRRSPSTSFLYITNIHRNNERFYMNMDRFALRKIYLTQFVTLVQFFFN